MDKKVVYWKNQNVTEAFRLSTITGWWEPVPLEEKQWWEPKSFDFYEIVATEEQFASRKGGCVVW
jgi:hypothetical protein